MTNTEKIRTVLFSTLVPTIIIIILVICIAIAVNYISKMGPAEISRKTEHYAQMADYTQKNATVFFGDSITELCKTDSIYGEYSVQSGTPVVNRGISAECTDSMLERVNESIIAIQPKNLVMLMGVNDLNKGISEQKITENIKQIIIAVKKKSPQTNIVLQAVYPTDVNRDSFYERFQLNGRDSETIRSLNQKLKTMADEQDVIFLDVTHLLADENGNLRKDYTFDGLHPNVNGYLAVRDEIIKTLV